MSWQNPPPFPPPPFAPYGPPPHPGVFQGFGEAGNGVDHTTPDHGFEFGPGAFNAWSGPFGFGGTWGPRGRGGWGFGLGPRGGRRGRGHYGRRQHRENDNNTNEEDLYDITAAAAAAEADLEEANQAAGGDAEKANSPATMAASDGEHPDPPEEAPPSYPHRRHHGPGCRGRGRGFGPRRGGFRWHAPAGGSPFLPEGLQEMIRQATDAMARFNQQLGRGAGAATEADPEGDGSDSNTFTPPVDIFDTRDNWTIHVSLPGARKEDLGVNWDPAQGVLTIAGVVHRLGDEEFIAGLVSSERRIGVFERKIPLPPAQAVEGTSKDDVDGDHIQARMQDGILIVVVPKVEKEWTEVKKIDVL